MAGETTILNAGGTPPASQPKDTPAAQDTPKDTPASQDAPPKGDEAKPGDKPTDNPADVPGDKGEPEKAAEDQAVEVELKLSDKVKWDDKQIASFKEFAKEAKLTSENAQKLVDQYTEMVLQQQKDAEAADQARDAEWQTATSKLPIFQGESGAKAMAEASRAFYQFASPSLVSLLTASGLVFHPEFVQMMHRVSSAIAEDEVPSPTDTPGSAEAVSREKRLYPNLP